MPIELFEEEGSQSAKMFTEKILLAPYDAIISKTKPTQLFKIFNVNKLDNI